MKTALLGFVALNLMMAVGYAQKVGDSEQAVRKALGTAPMTRAAGGNRQIWVYPDGTKVVLKDGVVVEARIGPAKPQTPVEETAVSEAASQMTPSKPTVSRAAATPQNAPASNRRKAADFHRTGLGFVLATVAYILIAVCAIIITIEAFRNSVLWGLVVLLIPFAQLFFVVSHWAETKKPFLITWLVGLPLLVVSMMV